MYLRSNLFFSPLRCYYFSSFYYYYFYSFTRIRRFTSTVLFRFLPPTNVHRGNSLYFLVNLREGIEIHSFFFLLSVNSELVNFYYGILVLSSILCAHFFVSLIHSTLGLAASSACDTIPPSNSVRLSDARANEIWNKEKWSWFFLAH